MPLNLDYYYGSEAEQYSFYRIPKLLFTDSRFHGVSVEAKVLYGLLLDRMALSVKNSWLDAEGRVYIIFTIADIMGTLGCAEQKANKLLNELDTKKGIGLIERKRRGLGKPNVIYVKNFTGKEQNPQGTAKKQPSPEQNPPEQPFQELNPLEQSFRQQPSWEPQFKNCENHKSGNVITTDQELRKSQTSNTDFNDTNLSDTDPSIYSLGDAYHFHAIRSAEAGMMDEIDGIDRIDEGYSQRDPSGKGSTYHTARTLGIPASMEQMEAYRKLVKENVSYDALLQDRPYDRERLDGYIDLIVEVCCSIRDSIRVNQADLPAEAVKGRLLKLGMEHIRYVMDCMDRNTTLVGNIRAYTLSALYNAPATISQYYASLVRHDMAGSPGAG